MEKVAPIFIPAYKRLIPRQILRWLAAAIVATTVVGSFLPGPTKLRLGTSPYLPWTHHVTLQHRLYHFVMFGLMTFVFLMLADGVRREVKGAVGVFTLGLLIECLQHLTGLSEVMEWWDVLDDLYAVGGTFILIEIANAVAARTEYYR